MQERSPADVARTIIDTIVYMVLGTANEAGQPWTSPGYFASKGYKVRLSIYPLLRRNWWELSLTADYKSIMDDFKIPPRTG